MADNTPTDRPTDKSLAGDLPSLNLPAIALGPHAGRALGTLLESVTSIGTAWFNDFAQRIRDRTEARTTVNRASAERLAAELSTDPEFLQNTLETLFRDFYKRRQAVEQIVLLAADDLAANPSLSDTPASDDFIDRFEQFAKRASTPHLQTLFARILAGEIRAPGEFSGQTLHILSLLDPSSAEAVEQALRWVVDHRWIPRGGDLREWENQEILDVLQDIGLLRKPELIDLGLPGETVEVPIADHLIRISARARAPLAVKGYRLTRSGRDFLKITRQKLATEDAFMLGKAIYQSQPDAISWIQCVTLQQARSGRPIAWETVTRHSSREWQT